MLLLCAHILVLTYFPTINVVLSQLQSGQIRLLLRGFYIPLLTIDVSVITNVTWGYSSYGHLRQIYTLVAIK